MQRRLNKIYEENVVLAEAKSPVKTGDGLESAELGGLEKRKEKAWTARAVARMLTEEEVEGLKRQ